MEPTGSPAGRALIVEDAAELRDLIATVLTRDGFSVEAVDSGRAALASARAAEPDVVVLDLGLPDLDGIEVCRELRTFTNAYVVMLTARDDEVDKLIGLSIGADDYMTKPFSARELVARVRTMLRRPRGVSGGDIRRVGDLEIDVGARQARIGGSDVGLTRIEFDLLDQLSERPRVTFTREQLLERIWGPNWFGDDHLVDVHISKLRQKLGDDPREPRYVSTVRGVGYRLERG